ncbi:hypothetical protein D3C71_2003870 [compost metagenome]
MKLYTPAAVRLKVNTSVAPALAVSVLPATLYTSATPPEFSAGKPLVSLDKA